MDNQFINAPLLVNRSAQHLDPKDELIRNLQLKNSKLKTELIKIQRAMQQKFQGLQEEQGPRKRESIFQSQDNFQVLTKELANIYKRIKMYEYQIGKLQDSKRTVNVSQKTTQYQLMIKEKRAMSDKLKQQYTKEQKSLQEITRRLENNSQKDQMEIYMKKLTEQAKFYKQKLKFIEGRETTKSGNMKKQYEAIKKLENKLLEAGLAGGELEDIKRSAIKSINVNPARKTTVNESKVQSLRGSKEEAGLSGSEDEIEDKTKDHFEMLMGDVALLEKMLNDYERQIAQALEDRQDAINKNMGSRNKLLECENQIQNLEKEIQIMKGRVVPSNMKPLKPLRSLSSHQPENTQKLLPAKSFASPLKAKGLAHILRYDEVGLLSAKGQRFTDRTILGKSNLTSKIVGLRVYLDRSSGLIAGIQCSYSGNKKGGEYVRKDKDQKEKQYDEQVFVCRGSSFIRSISGTLSPDDRLQSLALTSSDGSSFKVGSPKTVRKNFIMDISSEQYPVCVFGSLLVLKELGKKESSLIEHIGFELQNDKAGTHPLALNEFNE